MSSINVALGRRSCLVKPTWTTVTVPVTPTSVSTTATINFRKVGERMTEGRILSIICAHIPPHLHHAISPPPSPLTPHPVSYAGPTSRHAVLTRASRSSRRPRARKLVTSTPRHCASATTANVTGSRICNYVTSHVATSLLT